MERFLRACRDAVLDNTPKTLCARMGVPHVSLLQRANDENDDHHLTIEHLWGILLHTRDHRPLTALAADFGYDLVARVQPAPMNLQSACMSVGAEVGDVQRAVHDALASGPLSSSARHRVLAEIAEAQHSLAVMAESVRVAP